MTHRAIRYPQPVCDKCGRFIPFKYGPNDFEWWSGGECDLGKGCKKGSKVKEPNDGLYDARRDIEAEGHRRQKGTLMGRA